ncbi:atrial natriuretic peptide-converting enzyme-like isoform X3 [Biomphalaria glabrata]|uniref:Atrial natriuretic peptide-converting enzyme-like isoform X3 n=1 Tax=Biomphalaria glabrata TaxID=6526 RepID=A0A9W2ZKZ0_BIOGL|nr:atrial natriuretic peptide-converting enzyme-like isoform X3 [Biomphalaria glabrata]
MPLANMRSSRPLEVIGYCCRACYDNPIFDQEDSRAYATQNGPSRTGKPGDYGADAFEDGMEGRGYATNCRVDSCHVANDYMHSLPVSPPLRNDIVFRSHRKRSRIILFLLVFLVVMAAITVGLLFHFVGTSTQTSSSISTSQVLTFTTVQGSLRIIAGPFSVYTPSLADSSSPTFIYFRNAFVFKMDTLFMSSSLANMYNKTQMLNVSGNKSHVLINFVMLPQSRFTASSMSALTDSIRSVIVSGMRTSIFVIDTGSLELKAMKPLTGYTVTPGECQPIVVSECVNQTSYNLTSVPNLLGHRSQAETEQYLKKNHNMLFVNPCHLYVTEFFCSVFVPECGPQGKQIPPCRKFCNDVLRQCHSEVLTKVNRDGSQTIFTCDDLPDSSDPQVCRQHPFENLPPGTCIPSTQFCHDKGYNQTSYPNLIGGVQVESNHHNFAIIETIQVTTRCFQHSMLFACYFFSPPCTGRPVPHNTLPVCSSLCQEFRDKCEIFLDIFDISFPKHINCSDLPDSPDPNVCVGYQEARELDDDHLTCPPGEIRCKESKCIKKSWLCDGYQDCDDNSDEANCAICPKGQVSCSPANGQCIHKNQSCDGMDDCYMSADEHFCVQIETNTAKDLLIAYNSLTTQWEEVCQDNWTQAMSSLACSQLGYQKVLTTYYTPANNSLRKSLLSERRNGSDPSRLQSYLAKGLQSCPSGFVVRLVCMDPECGTRPAYYRSPLRIMGGDDVKPGTYPWMVSLHGGRNQVFFCGATIIHEQWVMTAGHCVGEGDTTNLTYWTIKTGNTRRIAYSKHLQVRKPLAIIKHPAFSIKTVENDVALIKLDKPLAMNDFVRPICLPEMQPETGTRCYAVGWGKNSEKALFYESNLKQVPVDVTNWDYCKHATSNNEHFSGVPFNLTQTMFCAGGSSLHDACQGDSGGPLLCRKENTTDEWYQGGIVSWGVVCGTPNTPGVYTRLILYTNWIHETIANNTGP